MNKDLIIPLNNNLDSDKDNWFVNPCSNFDCGGDDVCDSCVGICRPQYK